MTARVVPLLDFVAAATPRFSKPLHLAPVAALFERAAREPVRAVISLPPRHGKTELVKHAVVRWLLADPSEQIIYASYAQKFAEKRSREMRGLFGRCGGKLDDDAKARGDWRTCEEPGGVWATSVEGSVTGEGGTKILVDDPHKGRAEAESQLERDRVEGWFSTDLVTRAEPGASIFVVQTRWHPDDLAGRLLSQGWEHVTLPALDYDGHALWPERFTAERLREIEETIGSYSWASLYMQSPRPRGGALFRDVSFYDALPNTFRIGKGIDLAYSAKTRADKSAAVVMLESGGLYYVVDVRTAQVRAPDFLAMLATIDTTYRGPWHWFTSSTETGLADLATATAGVHVMAERATVDKYMRAQSVAAAWNAGRVLLPRAAPWLDAFVSEVCGFVGVGDRHDDQVDALASAFERLGGAMTMGRGGAPASRPAIIRTRMGGGAYDLSAPDSSDVGWEHRGSSPGGPEANAPGATGRQGGSFHIGGGGRGKVF